MGTNKIDYEVISDSCSRLHELVNNMEDTVLEMQNKVKKMINTEQWNGIAADNYLDKFTNLCMNFQDEFYEMEQAVLFLEKCSEGYVSLEDRIKKEIYERCNVLELDTNASKYFKEV